MEIKVVLTADERLLTAIEMLTSVFNNIPVTTIQPTVLNECKESTKKATKSTVEKPVEEDAVEKTVERFTEKVQEVESKSEKEIAATTVEEPTHNLTIEDARLAASKLAGNGKQKELKEIFNQFNAPKLSAVKVEDYPAFIQTVNAKAEELSL